MMENTLKDTTKAEPPSYEEVVRIRRRSSVTANKQHDVYIIGDPENLPNISENSFQEKNNDADNKQAEYKVKDSKKIDADQNAPDDPLFFVLIVIVFIGLVHGMPMSFFGVANEYWLYKFRNTTLDTTDPNQRTYLQTNFTALSGVSNTVLAVITNLFLTFMAHNIKPMTRIMVTLILHTVIFGLHVIFVHVNTDTWQTNFFVLTIASMIIIKCLVSFGAAGQFALFTKLPPMYFRGYLFGSGIAEVFNSLLRLLSIMISPSPSSSALIYFVTGSTLLLVSTVMMYATSKTKFFRHYTNTSVEVKKPKVQSSKEIIEMLKIIWPILVIDFLIAGLPKGSVLNLVVSENFGKESNNWANKYFVTVCTFLIPSVMGIVGRAIENKLNWDWPLPALFIWVLCYQIFSTATVYLSNALPRHHLPVLLKHDWQYAVAQVVNGLWLGFSLNMASLKSVRMVSQEKTELTMLLIYLFNSITNLAMSPLGIVSIRIL